jgi:hypothetical protein
LTFCGHYSGANDATYRPVCGLRRALESLLQRGQVGRHLLASSAQDEQRDEDRADAAAFKLDRDSEPRRRIVDGFNSDIDDARIAPSTPLTPHVLGASMCAISDVAGRLANPTRLVVTHRAPTLGSPG